MHTGSQPQVSRDLFPGVRWHEGAQGAYAGPSDSQEAKASVSRSHLLALLSPGDASMTWRLRLAGWDTKGTHPCP